LLRDDIPPAGGCDIKTLASEAGVARNSLYTTYAHLKDEFEARRARLRDAGMIADPRDAQITRLKADIATLKQRAVERDAELADLTRFRALAISRLAAQHDEILRLRAHIARGGNVRALPPTPTTATP
jgi:hypothetical protein